MKPTVGKVYRYVDAKDDFLIRLTGGPYGQVDRCFDYIIVAGSSISPPGEIGYECWITIVEFYQYLTEASEVAQAIYGDI